MLSSCFLCFLLILFPWQVASRENDYELEDFQEGRIFSLNTSGPLTREIGKLQPVLDAFQLTSTHLTRVEKAIRVRVKRGEAPSPDDPVQPCSYKEEPFGNAARRKALTLGWAEPAVSCLTGVLGTDFKEGVAPGYSVGDLYKAVSNSGKVLQDNIRSITESAINNFSKPDYAWNYPYETPSQRCTLHPTVAYRVSGRWVLGYQFTNRPKSAQLAINSRHTIAEYPYLVNGELKGPELMCLPVRPKTGTEHVIRTDTTTVITTFRGAKGPSPIRKLLVEDNPAILGALDQSDLFVQQAEDAVTASSIAILFLPLGLNLVPIALLANVDTLAMLLYTIMSDVVTVIPLGIKGAELINIGLQRHRSVFVRMTGAVNGSSPEVVVAEMHVAECRAHSNVLPTGVAFLVLASVFLVGGVAAEFIARSWVMKRRKHYLDELETAESELSSRGSSERSNTASRRSATSAQLSSLKFQPQGAVGSPFRSGSFTVSYAQHKRDKKA